MLAWASSSASNARCMYGLSPNVAFPCQSRFFHVALKGPIKVSREIIVLCDRAVKAPFYAATMCCAHDEQCCQRVHLAVDGRATASA